MVHGIPNVSDAAAILRDELDQLSERFGPIEWVRMGPNLGSIVRTMHLFETKTQRSTKKLSNRVGIKNTNIWFEINPLATRKETSSISS